MAPLYGTLSVLDTLATYNNSNVLAFGEDQMAGFLRIILAAHEQLVADMMADFTGTPPDRQTTYGINTSGGDMVEVDEFGLADAQKIPFAPSQVGFPLRKTQYTLQWTRDFLATITPLEMANQVLSITLADERYFYAALRRVLLKATNNTAYIDRFADNSNYTIRALVNADSQGIPPQPVTAATFDGSTHTHYLASASFIEANLVALYETVREHGLNGGSLRVFINSAQETAVRAFAGFHPYTDARIIYSQNADRAATATSQENLEDRAIGFHGAAEIWVKPWMLANYLVSSVVGGGGDPVIGWRKPAGVNAQFADLRIAAELDRFPLHAQTMQRMLGFGIWNRIRAAALYIGGGSYVVPTI